MVEPENCDHEYVVHPTDLIDEMSCDKCGDRKKIYEALNYYADRLRNIEYIQHMQKLELKEGDVIVIKIDQRLSGHAYADLGRLVNDSLKSVGLNCKCLVLEEGTDIGVLRKENAF